MRTKQYLQRRSLCSFNEKALLGHLPIITTLAVAGFFAGDATGLESAAAGVFCTTDVGVGAVVVAVLLVVIVAAAGAELTKTGSVEGMGLPSLVCNFTT